MKAGLFVVAVAGVVALAIGLLLRRSDPSRAPDFTLVERSGRPISRHDLIGEVWVADFVFTNCPGACPAMMSRMYELQKRVPEARYLSITSDPERDTPAAMARYFEVNLPGIVADRWHFATAGSFESTKRLSEEGFKLSLPDPSGHSLKFVLVDRVGRVRGTFDHADAGEMVRLEMELRRLLAERTIPLKSLPAANAVLNGASAVLLASGFLLIRSKRVGAHRACMLAALAASALFLACYLVSHYYVGSVKYPRTDWTRPLYFAILISHSALAALIVPLAGITLTRAFQERFDRHRAIARWTLPLWLYVSVTGVVLYFMLY
jgi:uncharacterized membrane protein YozB (DUF420 family)